MNFDSSDSRRTPFDSSDTRRAAEFDTFRRALVLTSKTVSGEAREVWFERFKTLVEALFPDAERNVRKPGLATRLFSVEVSLPGQDKFHLLDMCTELDDNWRAMIKEDVKGGASCVYRDRLDAIWEWVVDLGNCFVTGHVKLRNFHFEPEKRPQYRSFDRPERARYGDRPSFDDRQRRERPPFDRANEGPSGPPGSDRPYRNPRPQGGRPNFGDRGPRKFGKGGPGRGRPKG